MSMRSKVRAHVRGLIIAVGVVSAVAIPAGAGQAAPPGHTSFSFTDTFVDPDYCAAEGLTLTVSQEVNGHIQIFLNDDGSFRQAIVQQSVAFAISANGKTLHESDHWQTFVDADGTVREVGLFGHVQGDAGLVLRDAGQIVLNPDDTVAYIRGPHPQFLGQTFCTALLP